jgi:hypothetical protein
MNRFDRVSKWFCHHHRHMIEPQIKVRIGSPARLPTLLYIGEIQNPAACTPRASGKRERHVGSSARPVDPVASLPAAAR